MTTAHYSIVAEQEASTFEFSIREINEMNASSECTELRRFRAVQLVERVRLALELLTWAALVWNTPWTKNMCICSLQQSSTRTGEAVFRMLPRLPATPHQCSLCRILDDIVFSNLSVRRDAQPRYVSPLPDNGPGQR